jgi:phosphopentomutase
MFRKEFPEEIMDNLKRRKGSTFCGGNIHCKGTMVRETNGRPGGLEEKE